MGNGLEGFLLVLVVLVFAPLSIAAALRLIGSEFNTRDSRIGRFVEFERNGVFPIVQGSNNGGRGTPDRGGIPVFAFLLSSLCPSLSALCQSLQECGHGIDFHLRQSLEDGTLHVGMAKVNGGGFLVRGGQ